MHVHFGLKVNIIIICLCGLLYAFQSSADLTKSEKYASFATTILML